MGCIEPHSQKPVIPMLLNGGLGRSLAAARTRYQGTSYCCQVVQPVLNMLEAPLRLKGIWGSSQLFAEVRTGPTQQCLPKSTNYRSRRSFVSSAPHHRIAICMIPPLDRRSIKSRDRQGADCTRRLTEPRAPACRHARLRTARHARKTSVSPGVARNRTWLRSFAASTARR